MFAYTTVVNVLERPDGVRIASFFIAAIVVTSIVSRASRATELRVEGVQLDATAQRLVDEEAAGDIRIIANEPNERDEREYREKEQEVRRANHIPDSDPVLFLEVTVVDPSEFSSTVQVTGEERHGYRILRVESATVGNTIAAVLLSIRDRTGQLPTSTSAGPRATRSCTWCATWSSGTATCPRSPARCCARPSGTGPAAAGPR